MDIATLPREILSLNLRLARIPLDAAERVARRGDDDTTTPWPPAIAFENAEVSIKQALGSLWKDEQLLTDARLQRARVAELRRALEEQARAERIEATANAVVEDRIQRTEVIEEHIEDRAEAQKRQVAQQKAAAERQVAEQAAREKAAAAKVAERREAELARQTRQADIARLDSEARALSDAERAAAAKAEAQRIKAAAANIKKARKA